MTFLTRFRLTLAPSERQSVHSSVKTRNRPGRQRSSRAVVTWFVVAIAVAHVAMLHLFADATIRDPEYGRRVSQLRERLRENPGRPLVLVLGSSRAAIGVSPAAWEEIRPPGAQPDPLLFNMSLVGSGPLLELIALRRVYADGFRPAVVLVEYWPPFLHGGGEWDETVRITSDRLVETDGPVVRDFFPDPEPFDRELRRRQANPIHASGDRFLMSEFPSWIPSERRVDWLWRQLDGWGWMRPFDAPPNRTPERSAVVARCANIYRPLFASYRYSPTADRAFREIVTLAREHGTAVSFLYMPESSEFRGMYPKSVERIAKEHLATLSRELDVPVINCREWMPDPSIVDGFHLSRSGAAEFTRKLMPAVIAAWPAFQTGASPRGQP